MQLYYQRERDKDFFQTCEAIRLENRTVYISVRNIAKEAINKEAQSFYLNIEVYARIINKVRAGGLEKVKNPLKKKLYMELWNRYIRIKSQNQSLNSTDCAKIIAEQKAPQFYLSERHAVNIYYRLLKDNPK